MGIKGLENVGNAEYLYLTASIKLKIEIAAHIGMDEGSGRLLHCRRTDNGLVSIEELNKRDIT